MLLACVFVCCGLFVVCWLVLLRAACRSMLVCVGCCFLRAVRCLVVAVCGMLCGMCWVLFVACCLVVGVRCVLFVVCCVLLWVGC